MQEIKDVFTEHTNLETIVSRFSQSKILVIGDVMLDHYRIAEATRISPEAPVPILLNPRDEFRLGGAAAVAAMSASLGAETTLIGLLGDDPAGDRVVNLLQELGVTWGGVVSSRPTTTKERIVAVASGRHRQQLGRIDRESLDTADPVAINRLIQRLGDVPDPDVILISDYGKGVCQAELIRVIRHESCPVLVDPPRHGDWGVYQGVTALIPNRQEAAGRTALRLLHGFDLRACVIKLDEQGAELAVAAGDSVWHIPTSARRVYDVTGAGDQFLAMLGLALVATNEDWRESVNWANLAAGLQVERHGCVPVTIDDLIPHIASPVIA